MNYNKLAWKFDKYDMSRDMWYILLPETHLFFLFGLTNKVVSKLQDVP